MAKAKNHEYFMQIFWINIGDIELSPDTRELHQNNTTQMHLYLMVI